MSDSIVTSRANDGAGAAEVTVIMVSYNTRELTLKAIETLLRNAGDVLFKLVVWDNASADGSADAVAERFPEIELIRSAENVGFAMANNIVAEAAETEWLLLLNPDTETHPAAVENLLAFARANPQAGIVGGRTVFPDGSLNIASCWSKMTPWSLFCSATGLTSVFPRSAFFNPEAMGNWQRDTVREVDIVVGCFFLIRTQLWRELDGFSPRYFMYGEEADMCLRAAQRGYKPMITPDAQIMHLVGAATSKREDKLRRLLKAKVTLVRDHWSPAMAPIGVGLLLMGAGARRVATGLRAKAGKSEGREETWKSVWENRKDWLEGY